jgi:hypothetical protein
MRPGYRLLEQDHVERLQGARQFHVSVDLVVEVGVQML